MSASTLREAAAKLRGLAEGASRGDWEPGERIVWTNTSKYGGPGPVVSDGLEGDGGTATPADAAYIAAMSPIVALALADWLDDAANSLDYEATETDAALAVLFAACDPAFHVAEAILGPRA